MSCVETTLGFASAAVLPSGWLSKVQAKVSGRSPSGSLEALPSRSTVAPTCAVIEVASGGAGGSWPVATGDRRAVDGGGERHHQARLGRIARVDRQGRLGGFGTGQRRVANRELRALARAQRGRRRRRTDQREAHRGGRDGQRRDVEIGRPEAGERDRENLRFAFTDPAKCERGRRHRERAGVGAGAREWHIESWRGRIVARDVQRRRGRAGSGRRRN